MLLIHFPACRLGGFFRPFNDRTCTGPPLPAFHLFILYEWIVFDLSSTDSLQPDLVTEDIFQIGAVNGSATAELGMPVKKSGRTTGLTTGEIQQVDVTVNVQYGAGKMALFTDQLMAGAMSQGGDSGSAVLDDNNRLVGLLFAGSDQTTIINRIGNVFAALGISL